MTFEEAVGTAPAPVCDAYRPGKQALKGDHSNQVTCQDTRRFTGSIDLEAALMQDPAKRQPHLWDYGLGFRQLTGHEVTIWIEVHTASTTEVKVVLGKHAWLRDWLRDEAPSLDGLTQQGGCFVWLATEAGVHIQANSPQARRLRQAGLDLPRRRLELR